MGKFNEKIDENTTITLYSDLQSSGKNFGGAETIYREYTDEEKKTEYSSSTVQFKSQGLTRRLLFGPGYQDATCSKVSREGVPCQSCSLWVAHLSWPDAIGLCTDD